MSRSQRRERMWRSLSGLRNYCIFFLTMCFIVTCCMIPFLQVMSHVTGYVWEREAIKPAAQVTFINVMILSLVCTFIDFFRRKIMVDRPVKHIVNGAEKVMNGDFSVRIRPKRGIGPSDGFNTVMECFNRMTEELSKMETLRTDFIANVSHELKTPLAVMHNYATMLQQPGLSEEKRKEYAKAIECLPGFEEIWEKKELDIQTDIQENVRVTADPELLSLVWNNLFSNAIKFTEPGGTVSLSLEAQGEMAVVKVSDTGCGIPQDIGAHIFEKFYQGDTSHATQGNGLGLALVKRVIDIMHGEIAVNSQVGKGSTFTVRLGREMDETITLKDRRKR